MSHAATSCPPPGPFRIAVALLLVLLTGCSQGKEVEGEWYLLPRGETVRPKVMLIGLDGADFRKLLPLAEAGRLPNLGALMERGVRVELETVATASPIVWTTVATGVVPEKHGIEFFRDETRKPAATTHRKVAAFWNVLTRCERTVGVVSWWATFPAERVNGYLVSPYVVLMPPRGEEARVHDLGAPEDAPRKAWPPGLHDELAHLLKRPEDVDVTSYPRLYADPVRTTNTPWVIAKDTSYYEVARHLLDAMPVETVAFYFQGIDAASHDWDRYVMGKPVDAVRDPIVSPEEVEAATARVDAMYELMDEMVGGLVAKADARTDVIVMSDHGWNYDGTSHWSEIPGIFIAAGPSFRGAFRGELSVLDIAPVLLAILGVPLSRELDGELPDGLLTASVMQGVRYVDAYGLPPNDLPADYAADASELDAQMTERLQALGYLGDDGEEEWTGERSPESEDP